MCCFVCVGIMKINNVCLILSIRYTGCVVPIRETHFNKKTEQRLNLDLNLKRQQYI